MNPVVRHYKPEYAKDLLAIAAGDLDSARILAASDKGRRENVCFLAHQVVEKCLKAVLCFRGQPILHTHDLEALVVMLGVGEQLPHAASISSLTQYSMVRRYEEGFEILTQQDLDLSVAAAADILQWANASVGIR